MFVVGGWLESVLDEEVGDSRRDTAEVRGGCVRNGGGPREGDLVGLLVGGVAEAGDSAKGGGDSVPVAVLPVAAVGGDRV